MRHERGFVHGAPRHGPVLIPSLAMANTKAPLARRALLGLALAVLAASPAAAAPTLKGRAVWANPREAGLTEASVVAFVDQLARAHVNTLVMEVKTSAGIF